MNKRLRALVAPIVALVLASACSKSPTSPDPPAAKVCEDPAHNAGQPPPCAYPIAPVLKVVEITPASGSTLTLASPNPKVTVEWAFDPYLPGRVAVAIYSSIDCETPLPFNRSSTAGGTSGKITLSFSPPLWNAGIKQTNCVIARLETVDDKLQTIGVVTSVAIPWVFQRE